MNKYLKAVATLYIFEYLIENKSVIKKNNYIGILKNEGSYKAKAYLRPWNKEGGLILSYTSPRSSPPSEFITGEELSPVIKKLFNLHLTEDRDSEFSCRISMDSESPFEKNEIIVSQKIIELEKILDMPEQLLILSQINNLKHHSELKTILGEKFKKVIGYEE